MTHVFPLRAKPGGVLVRAGQTEGSVDLARLAGLKGAAVICEIMNDDGTMARMPQLCEFAAEHDMKIATIADLIAYRSRKDSLVRRVADARMPTSHGESSLNFSVLILFKYPPSIKTATFSAMTITSRLL